MRLVLKSAVVVAVLALFLFAAPRASAANACVSNATGVWSATGTWTTCGGVVPTSADTVQIRGGFTVTVDVSNAAAASIQVGGNPGTLAGTLLFNSGSQVTVAGTVTLGGATSTTHGTITMTAGGTLIAGGLALGTGGNTKTWTPGTGTVRLTGTNTIPATIYTSFNNLTITALTTTLGASIPINGTLTQSGGNIAVGSFTLTVNGTHSAGTNTVSGAGGYTLASTATLQSGSTTGVDGNILTTTKTLNVAANYTFNGSSAQVTGAAMPATVNNLIINNAAGVTLTQSTTVSGSLTVTAGTFTVGAFTLSVTAATAVSGTLSITSTTGTKTFTGNVTINSGGTWSETVNEDISFGGSLQNDGTFTAGTGIHTFTGTAQTISGANAIGIPSLTISGTTTNNGTLTVSTTLAGASTLTNGATGTLNFGGSSITPTLTATASGNSVNYTLAGAQTVQATTYYNLTLSGSGAKTTTSVVVNGTLSMQGTATASTAATYGATATLEYKGSSAQTSGPELLATMAAGRTVVINNSAGVTLGANATVNGTLTFTSGTMATGANTLYIGSGGSVSRTSGHVVGNFKKFITTGATSMTFELGDASNYTPALVSFASVTTGGDLTASVASGDHANIGTSTISAATSVNRNWTLTNSGIVFTTYDATFTFVAGDVDGGASTSTFIVGKYSGASWAYPTVGTKTSISTQATGVTALGAFQLGNIGSYTISGHIQNASAILIAGVTVTLSGGQAGSTTTDSSGNYSFASLPLGNYTVTPTKTNYTFSPTSRTYNSLSANQTVADFTGTSTISYHITGATNNGSGVPIPGVLVSLSGGSTNSATTDENGSGYDFFKPSTNNYTITPTKTNYIFSPASATCNNLSSDCITNFTGTTAVTFTISGHIQDGSATALSGVTVSAKFVSTGQTAATGTTDASGNYSFANLDSGLSYNIIPVKTSYTFVPTNLLYTNLSANQSTTNFTGTFKTYTLDGSITNPRGAMSGVTVTLSGGQAGTTTTDGAGHYSFTNLPRDLVYTLTPSMTGYIFSNVSETTPPLVNSSSYSFAGFLLYSISGHIQNASNASISGVTVTLSGAQSGSTTTDANGNYSFANAPEGVSSTVTPTKTNYTFSPAFRSYTNLSANQTAADFTGTSTVTYTISGHIQNASAGAIASVTVTLSGGQSRLTSTDASGNYSFASVPSTNNYTVTATKTNYTFSAALTYNNLSANQTTADFTGTSTITYTISGHIPNASAVAIASVTVTLSGGQSGSTTTDASGNYSFAGLPSTNNYTVTPTKTNYTFSAASFTYNALAANQTTADFIGTSTITYTISGHIQNASSVAIASVTVTLSGGQSGSTSTDASGNYSFAGLPSTNNYTVTPTKTNYTFSAANLTYNALTANQTTADFTGTSTTTYTISGHIQNASAVAIASVTVTLSGGQSGSTSTDASGDYSFAGLPSTNNYTVTPSLTNYTFSAASLTYNSLSANQTTADFTVTPSGYTISGHIADVGSTAISGVTVSLSGGQSSTTTTDASGNYSFASLTTGLNYTLTPSKTNYALNPPSRTFNNLTANQVADFTAALVPNVTLTASVSPTGTVAPHTDLVYTTSFSNGGAGSASAFVITDPIPTNTDFKLSSMTTSLGTTGLTPTLSYSNDGGASWTYTPASAAGGAPAGYDRNVTHIRWVFVGNLCNGAPNNAGNAGFTVRIR